MTVIVSQILIIIAENDLKKRFYH